MKAALRSGWLIRSVGGLLAASLVALLVLPMLALVLSVSIDDIRVGVADPTFASALGLSVRTTLVSLGVVVVFGTPLAWWIAASRGVLPRVVGALVELPVVMPPAVIGVGLLQAFGRQGVLGPSLDALGLAIPFTSRAVVLAQVVVAAPFFVQSAVAAFREVDRDAVIVARTLGASPLQAFLRVTVPIATPGLLVGASLAWARALGEFGATLLFAGNMPGRTQTMPLAIYSALESDVRVAVVFSLALVATAALALAGLRFFGTRQRRGRT